MSNKIVITNSECGDWSGIYVNGILFYEGHSIDNSVWIDVIKRYKVFSGEIHSYWIADEWLENRGNFPDKFNDIQKEFLHC